MYVCMYVYICMCIYIYICADQNLLNFYESETSLRVNLFHTNVCVTGILNLVAS